VSYLVTSCSPFLTSSIYSDYWEDMELELDPPLFLDAAGGSSGYTSSLFDPLAQPEFTFVNDIFDLYTHSAFTPSIPSSCQTVYSPPASLASPAATEEPISPKDTTQDGWVAAFTPERSYGSSKSGISHPLHEHCAYACVGLNSSSSGPVPTRATSALQMRSSINTLKSAVSAVPRSHAHTASYKSPFELDVEALDEEIEQATRSSPITVPRPARPATPVNYVQGRAIAPSGHYDMPIASPVPMPSSPQSAPASQTSFSYSSSPTAVVLPPPSCVSPRSMVHSNSSMHDIYHQTPTPPPPATHQHQQLHPQHHFEQHSIQHQQNQHLQHQQHGQHQQLLQLQHPLHRQQYQQYQHPQHQYPYHHRSMSEPGQGVAYYDARFHPTGVVAGDAIEPVVGDMAPPPRRNSAAAAAASASVARTPSNHGGDIPVPPLKRRILSGPSGFANSANMSAATTPRPSRPPSRAASTSSVGRNVNGGGGGGGGMSFINYTARDAQKILSGVAPSGSSKRNKRKAEEESDRADEAKAGSSSKRGRIH
jgi:hypothetical protein